MIISRDGSILVITPLNSDDYDKNGAVGTPYVQGQKHIEAAVLLLQIHYLKQQNHTLETEIQVLQVSANKLIGKLHRTVTITANFSMVYSRVRTME